MTLVIHPVHQPLHAQPAPRHRVALVLTVFAALTAALLVARPTLSSWRARESRALPAALVNTSGGLYSLGVLALDDPVTVVFGALGEPDLTSSSVTRTTMTWAFDATTIAVTLSAGLTPIVVGIDAYSSGETDDGPVFAGGIVVGRSTIGALVGRLGAPTDVGTPMPTSARWVRVHRGATVVIEADAGTWASMLSSRVGHLHIGYDDASPAGGLYDPDRR